VAARRDIVEYDIVKDLYKLEFVADGEVNFMTFEDVLSVLPKSWFGEQTRAHQARIIHSLDCAAHADSYLGFGNESIQAAPLLSEKFTESGDDKMCCKAPDYFEWPKTMIKKIRTGENALMESCQVVLDKDAATLKVFSPTCSHSIIRLVLALTSVSG